VSAERARAEKAEAELAHLAAPRPAPRCPECGSEWVGIRRCSHQSEIYCASCQYCDLFVDIDAALDAWRPNP
jgi:transcription elongation factor Elf1